MIYLVWPPRDSNSHVLRHRFLRPTCLPFHQRAFIFWVRSNAFRLPRLCRWISSERTKTLFVDQPGLEPGTYWLWVRRSNQLSYKSNIFKERERWFSGQSLLQLALLRWIPPNSDYASQYPRSSYRHNHSPINLNCDPGWIWTNDIHFRRVALYPTELQNQCSDLLGVAAGSPIEQI